MAIYENFLNFLPVHLPVQIDFGHLARRHIILFTVSRRNNVKMLGLICDAAEHYKLDKFVYQTS